MDFLAEREKKKYEILWGSCPEYRMSSPADCLTPLFLRFFQSRIKKGDSVLDFGCGPGRSAPYLLGEGLDVHLFDLSENCLDPEIFLQTIGSGAKIAFSTGCLWDLPLDLKPADWILCIDVMEHLPKEKVESALLGMSIRMRKGGVFGISLREDYHGSTIGETLHLTLENSSWWKEKVSGYFPVVHEISSDEEIVILAVEGAV